MVRGWGGVHAADDRQLDGGGVHLQRWDRYHDPIAAPDDDRSGQHGRQFIGRGRGLMRESKRRQSIPAPQEAESAERERNPVEAGEVPDGRVGARLVEWEREAVRKNVHLLNAGARIDRQGKYMRWPDALGKPERRAVDLPRAGGSAQVQEVVGGVR